MKNLIPLRSTRNLAKIIAVILVAMLLQFSAARAQNTYSIHPDTVTCYTDIDLKVYMTVVTGSEIASTGSITIQLPPNWGKPQDTACSINASNYITARCTTNSSVVFSIVTDDWMNPIIGIYTNEVHVIHYQITSAASLVNGDVVEFDFGCYSTNGRGFTPSRLAKLEHFYFQTKHDSLHTTLPSAVDSFPILQQPQNVYRITALAKSNPDINSQFELKVVAYDKLNNPCHYGGTIHFSNFDGTMNLPNDYTFTPLDNGVHSFFLSISDTMLHRIQISDGTLTGMSNPLIVDNSGLKVFWGDLHTHSQLSHHGLSYPIDVFNYGKKISFLDYLAFTEHSYIPDSQYRAGISIGNQFNQDGSFVTFNGYEWSTLNYGHQCAYFKDDNPPAIITNYNSPNYFINTVRAQGGLINITHPSGLWGTYASFYVNWSYFDPAVQTNSEITGNSGICFEIIDNSFSTARQCAPGTSVQDGLAANHVFGFIGASDNHQGRPGKNPNPEATSAYTYVYPNLITKDVGLSASFAPALNRTDIFTSLANRHNYATTGARILMKFNIGNHVMGDYFTWDSLAMGLPVLHGTIHGTDTITQIDIVRNNQTLVSFTPGTYDYTFSYTDSTAAINSYYYLRVSQSNTDMAWSSPIWLLDSSAFTTNNLYLQSKFDIDVFPSPNQGQFEIKFFNNFSATCDISITDVAGKEVYKLTKTVTPFTNARIPIDIPGLASGMYLVNVNCDNYLVHKKMFVESIKK